MASRFWVGGTGTWDSTTTTHWSATTGGAGGASAPVTGDSVTLDGASGGGTVTVDTTINGLSLAQITMGAFTGTLDFSVNNPNLTLTTAFSVTGTGVRTLNLGSGTFTLTGGNAVWDATTTTNLTLSAGSSTLLINGALSATAARQVQLGSTSLTYGTITIAQSGTVGQQTQLLATANQTIGHLNFTPPIDIVLSSGITYTISNAFTWAGTAFNSAIAVRSASTVTPVISAASGSTINWGVLEHLTFSGTAVNATNSIDLQGNNMNGGSITGPSGTSGSHMIGG